MQSKKPQREKNLDKAAKEAKVKARREAARAADLADGVSDQDLARLEDEFWAQTGVAGGTRLRLAGRGEGVGEAVAEEEAAENGQDGGDAAAADEAERG